MKFYTTEQAKENPYFIGWVNVQDFQYAVNECYECGAEETKQAFHNVNDWLCERCGRLVQRGLDLADYSPVVK